MTKKVTPMAMRRNELLEARMNDSFEGQQQLYRTRDRPTRPRLMQVSCQVMTSEKCQSKPHPSKEIRSITTVNGLALVVNEAAAFGSRLLGFRARPNLSAIIRSGPAPAVSRLVAGEDIRWLLAFFAMR